MLMIYSYNLKIWKVKFSGRNSIHTLMSQRGLIFAARVLEMNLFRVIDCPCSNTIDVISLFEIWTWVSFYWFFSLTVKQLVGSYYSTRINKQCKSLIAVLMHRQYLEKWFFCGEEEKQRRKIFGEEEYVIGRREEKRTRKRRKILGEGKYMVGEGKRKRREIFGEGKYLFFQRRGKRIGGGKYLVHLEKKN